MDLHAWPLAALPEHLFWQVLTFDRLEWRDAFVDDPEPEILPAAWHPRHFVLARGAAVISHAAVVERQVEHRGESWKAYGLSCVFTFPAFRGRAHGRQVVEAASAHIDRMGDGDLALLFTEPALERFYRQCGWQALPSTVILAGDQATPKVNPGLAMLRPLSRQVDAQMLADASLYIGRHPW